ncbi:MAG: A24 family peptidase, partial [bacterium]|nr:A24 family peptidase [bacterium]
ELATAVGAVILYQLFSHSFISLFVYSFISFSFLVIFFSDLKYQIIPDSMILMSLISTFGLMIFSYNLQPTTYNRLLSALGASGFLFFLWLVTRGRGMGLGDVKLAFVIGLFLGFPKTLLALYFAILTGAIAGVIVVLLRKKSLKSAIAFGPFLLSGMLFAIVFGESEIIQSFLKGVIL